ncbi:MAG: hypothetical protein NTZ15_21785 [Burkholderiales bacterium]|nr:hypothetical protein [Burkholderiales bacterium]
MTYQGARPEPNESQRVFHISAIRWDKEGHVGDVSWAEISSDVNQKVTAPTMVPVADVVDAIHDGAQVSAAFPHWPVSLPPRPIEVMKRLDGSETIVLVQNATAVSADLPDLDDLPVLHGSSRQGRAGLDH